MKIEFLLVTCCLEQSRLKILSQVIDNLKDQAPDLLSTLTVFDNASSEPGIRDLLKDNFTNVFQSNRNVGYWSAIDWWLEHITDRNPTYTYIIESDMIHYDFNKIWNCIVYLDNNSDVGSIRLHEYCVSERHLYNKDRPVHNSRKGLWQTHINRQTGLQVKIDHSVDDIWSTTFLTQLPAINRYHAMKDVFLKLNKMSKFSELDFQKFYWEKYQRTGILDGGIFHCNLNPYGAKIVTGSWTSESDLKRLGYQPTRTANIVPINQYIVSQL